MNTAVLTGRQVSQAMKVFIVSQAGKVADVTLQSSCHAEDESVIKVSKFFLFYFLLHLQSSSSLAEIYIYSLKFQESLIKKFLLQFTSLKLFTINPYHITSISHLMMDQNYFNSLVRVLKQLFNVFNLTTSLNDVVYFMYI